MRPGDARTFYRTDTAMGATQSIFFNFELPTATTWFYFSLLLAVALFFKFSRLLSMRNLDLLSLFLPVPGLLLLLEDNNRWGYIWLAGASGFLLLRCLFDLTLVRRPALAPNLNLGGLAWLATALFISLVAVAVKEPARKNVPDRNTPPAAAQVQREGEQLLPPGAVPDRSLWVERALAITCHLAIVAGLVCVGWRHFQDIHAGMAMATFYLLLPYTYLLLPRNNTDLGGQWYHVWPSALLIWAVVAYRRPTVSGLLLGVGAGSVYFPVLVLPIWLRFYWRRGAGRFAGAFALGAGLCLVWLGVQAWLNGQWPGSAGTLFPLNVRDWLPWEPALHTPGLWQEHAAHWAYRMPVFMVYLALALAAALRPGPKSLAHLLALSAALLIGTQFWYADRGGIHILWYLPLLLLLAFRPNLADRLAPPLPPDGDWLSRGRRSLGRFLASVLGLRRPSVKVH
jgi:hypothetical protein